MRNYKFKPGDRVRCTEGNELIKTGATGTVDEYSTAPFVIWDSADMLTDKGRYHGKRWAKSEDTLELIESASEPTETIIPAPLEAESTTVKFTDGDKSVTLTYHIKHGWTIQADSGIHAGQLIEAITRFNQ